MFKKTINFIFCLLVLTVLILPVYSQTAIEWKYSEYSNDIPEPSEIIGRKLGENYTFHWEMADYIQAVEAASDRVIVKSYGKTYEGRKLFYIIISSPKNLANLEKIRESNLRLTDPRKTDKNEAERISKWMPSIVWLGYNVHGSEASCMEAAIRIIYQLAAGTDETTQKILDNIVCIIDPVQNPDGHERFVTYVRSIVTIKSHPQRQDVEHSTPWPGGRTNHYLFDLNRDFFLKTQIESLQKAKLYHKWMPHVFADLHEMGSNSTYFFAPPMTPYNEYVTRELKKWWDIISEYNAKAFDRYGWGYYTRESFPAFYPGYGTSYPCLNGAVGMTYEQASSRGVSIEREDGTVLTLKEATSHHFNTSMATLEAVADRRVEKIEDFYNFFVNTMKEAEKDKIKEIILIPDKDPQITAKLIENMLIEKVEIHKTVKPFSNNHTFSYIKQKEEKITFPEGSYVIKLKQPQRTLIKTLLAPKSPLSKEFIKKEEERKKKNERSHFYDVTAWSMPLTYGVNAYWTSEESDIESIPVTKKPVFNGSVENGKAKQAYLIPYNSISGSKMLIKLLNEDYKVRISKKSFTLDGKKWPKGTLVVRVNRNPESLHKRIRQMAEETEIHITAANHGLTEDGIDLGSGNIEPVIKPKIALLTRSPVSSYSYGAIHYLFEREYDVNFTRIDKDELDELENFNVLIMPDGWYRDFISGKNLEKFKKWISKGGTVIAIKGAFSWLREDTIKISKVKSLTEIPNKEDKDKKIEPDYTPGAIVKVNLNERSFLSYGCPSSVAVIVRSDDIFMPFEDETKNIGLYAPADELQLSGFIWPETKKYLAKKGWMFSEPYGKGKIISFAEEPNFRASYYGLNKLFLNAVLLAPSF